jgi:hypothetical protein
VYFGKRLMFPQHPQNPVFLSLSHVNSDYTHLFIHFTATTFRKRSMKGSQSGTPPAPTHNYETVLPNFSKKLPAEAAALAQNYETPLPKAATLPRDLSVCAGKDRTPPRIKFSQSVKVRGSTPEAVYMNVKETPTGEDVCAMNPWNHHKQWDRGFTHSQRGNGTMPDASNHQLMAEIEMGPISPGDPWENN